MSWQHKLHLLVSFIVVLLLLRRCRWKPGAGTHLGPTGTCTCKCASAHYLLWIVPFTSEVRIQRWVWHHSRDAHVPYETSMMGNLRNALVVVGVLNSLLHDCFVMKATDSHWLMEEQLRLLGVPLSSNRKKCNVCITSVGWKRFLHINTLMLILSLSHCSLCCNLMCNMLVFMFVVFFKCHHYSLRIRCYFCCIKLTWMIINTGFLLTPPRK